VKIYFYVILLVYLLKKKHPANILCIFDLCIGEGVQIKAQFNEILHGQIASQEVQ